MEDEGNLIKVGEIRIMDLFKKKIGRQFSEFKFWLEIAKQNCETAAMTVYMIRLGGCFAIWRSEKKPTN